jgi:hypothetical protein
MTAAAIVRFPRSRRKPNPFADPRHPLRIIYTFPPTLEIAFAAGPKMVLNVSTKALLRFYGQGGIRWYAMQSGLWLSYVTDNEWAALVAEFYQVGTSTTAATTAAVANGAACTGLRERRDALMPNQRGDICFFGRLTLPSTGRSISAKHPDFRVP